ncbi:NUDIX domain-containing protein [Clostridium polynesiense]|uniref:NUDIX domain-containing protein n=1 Tax=Clostridium polynesiense TaxID=1325933 RepID=UPI00058B452E|nr:NUDIX domain-containing protein [Clostridium polynesiense]
MEREARCQGVILKDDCILVLRQYNYKRKEEYWMLPGGELEQGESEEECVFREIKEETGLEIEIKEVLFDEKENRRDEYKRYITFLWTPIEGSVEAPGSETVSHRKILD